MIAIADLHFRADVPKCRTESPDEWLAFQCDVLRTALTAAQKRKSALYIAGDIFHTPAVPYMVRNAFVDTCWEFPDVSVHTIAGNHDLPYHNYALLHKSAYGSIHAANIHELPLRQGLPYGIDTDEYENTLFMHALILQVHDARIPNCRTAVEVLKAYPRASLIICGDVHTPYIAEHEGRTLIMLGNATVQSAGDCQTPCMWDIADTIERIPLPVGGISTQHLDAARARDERLDRFAEALQIEHESDTLSFLDVLRHHVSTLEGDAQTLVQELLNDIGGTK